MAEYTGKYQANGLRFGIVVARFNEMVTRNLLEGAFDALHRHGVDEENIDVAWVPGSFEIPLIAKQMALSGKYDAVICLGAVIRGATAHFDYVAGPCASGISQASLESNIPILFGVLTTDTVEQAVERSGTKCGNKGFDVALGAIEMVDLLRQLNQSTASTKKGASPYLPGKK